MKMRHSKDFLKHISEGKGFAAVITVCVGIIAAAAVWSRSSPQPYAAPTPPFLQEKSAASLMQQSLQSITATPLPGNCDPEWQSPLSELVLLRSFSQTSMVPYTGGIWAVHEAVDLDAAPGETVLSIADGKVTAIREDDLHGKWVEITHAGGWVTRYAGLASFSNFYEGDRIKAGSTVGFAGGVIPAEADIGSHIHLQIFHDGYAVDPLLILE